MQAKRPENIGNKLLVCLAVVMAVGAYAALAVGQHDRMDAAEKRIYRLEGDNMVQQNMLTYDRDRLNNLCTHFKTGCSQKYGK